jgi:serine/threonine-protein kinase
VIGTTLCHYRITAKLGEGGMGVVYRAHDERLDRDVAIKVLPEEVAADPARLARFEREAKALAALNHRNIAVVHGFERAVIPSEDPGSESRDPLKQENVANPEHSLENSGNPSTRPSDGLARDDKEIWFLVMELLEGETLREVISSGALPTSKAVEYATAIANGLAAAHDKDVVHRDLKPENVFLTRDGQIKILDFGLAKLRLPEENTATETPTETLQTTPGGVLGTVAYMSPEQLKGRPSDHRSDIFALGVVFYEMLAGERPFTGSTHAEISAATLKEDPRPVSSVSSSVPPTLSSLVSRCLEKRPGDRFSSAHDFSLTLGSVDLSAPALESFVKRRWPHILAVTIVAVIGLLVVFPRETLVDRTTGSIDNEPIRSIAILPLENMTGDSEQAYFVDGLHEELIATFARISAFDKVIARTSVMAFRDSGTPIRDIGRELRVDAVLEGSVRRSGSRVRTTIQLIDARTESHLWAGSFERDLSDILTLQSEVARAVADQVKLKLTPEEDRRLTGRRTVNEEAYQAYLKGVQLSKWPGTLSNLDRAQVLFQKAIELDPGFADAHFGLSFALYQLGRLYRPPGECLPLAYDEAVKAIELDDGLAEAHAVLGAIKLLWRWEWREAEARLRRAVELKPSNYIAAQQFAYFWIAAGQPENAISVMNQALEIDPMNARLLSGLGFIYCLSRRFDDGVRHMQSTLELHPIDPMVHWVSAVNLVGAGRHEEAANDMERLFEIAPSFRGNGLLLATLVNAQGLAGRTLEATRNLGELEKSSRAHYVPPSSMALAYIGMGDHGHAIELLEIAADENDTQLFFLVVAFITDPIRDDPRFEEILRKMNLPMR